LSGIIDTGVRLFTRLIFEYINIGILDSSAVNNLDTHGASMKTLFPTLSLCLGLALVMPLHAADAPAPATTPAGPNSNMQILLDKVKADKKLLVASNMSLTEEEAKVFWPVYEEYQKELGSLNDRLSKAIKAYAEAYKAGSLTDETAMKLTNEAIAIEDAEAQMRKSFAAKLGKTLPGKKAARYLQVESKIRAAVRFDLATQIPLAK
jgi:hypothetical protein